MFDCKGNGANDSWSIVRLVVISSYYCQDVCAGDASKDEAIRSLGPAMKPSILIENKHSRIVYSANLKKHIAPDSPSIVGRVAAGVGVFPVSFLPDARMLVAECRCLISLRVSRFAGCDYVKRIWNSLPALRLLASTRTMNIACLIKIYALAASAMVSYFIYTTERRSRLVNENWKKNVNLGDAEIRSRINNATECS